MQNKFETYVNGEYLSTSFNSKQFKNFEEIAKDMECKNIIVAGSNKAFSFGKLNKIGLGTYQNEVGNVIKFKWKED